MAILNPEFLKYRYFVRLKPAVSLSIFLFSDSNYRLRAVGALTSVTVENQWHLLTILLVLSCVFEYSNTVSLLFWIQS
jgi:hypothetical protein